MTPWQMLGKAPDIFYMHIKERVGKIKQAVIMLLHHLAQ